MAIYKKVSGDIVKVAGYGDIADNLTTLSPVMSLSAKQGNVLNTNKAERTDISSIITTGTKNTTGAQITSGTYFYLNGELVKAKSNIAVNADYTLNTNYELATVGGVLTELNSNLNNKQEKLVNTYNVSTPTTIIANRLYGVTLKFSRVDHVIMVQIEFVNVTSLTASESALTLFNTTAIPLLNFGITEQIFASNGKSAIFEFTGNNFYLTKGQTMEPGTYRTIITCVI